MKHSNIAISVYGDNETQKFKGFVLAQQLYLLQEEQYDRLFVNHYVITSFGRVYSLRYDKFLKPKFYNSNVYLYASGKNFTLLEQFKERGWKHDKVEILKHYINNNWNHTIHENCLYANDI